MLDKKLIRDTIPHTVSDLTIAWPYERSSGKVRESFHLPPDQRLLVATDRLSAFDKVLTTIPFKGQVLNQLSAFWFHQLADLVSTHLIAVADPNVSVIRECAPLPVEVIVRGYITGSTKTSLWTLYAAGKRSIYGYTFPEGLQKHDKLPEPIITPTTKAGSGQHDERLTCAEVVTRGLVTPDLWEQVQATALAIFERGQEIAEAAGFHLVDTKYEFGLAPDGTLTLIDEVHTPDSSRFWRTDTMDQEPPEQWDKEFVRLWYAAQDYRGDGESPELPDDVKVKAACRYIALYEGLTGEAFTPGDMPAEQRIVAVLESFLER